VFAFLILPVLVSGFIVCKYSPEYYYKIHRYRGQYLYFTSAYLGVIALLIFSVLVFLIHKFVPSSIFIFTLLEPLLSGIWLEKTKADLVTFAWIILFSLGTILISFLWSFFSKIKLKFKAGTLENSRIVLMSKVLSDNPMDKLFFESYLYSRPLLLSLDSGKVYVGTINSLGELNESDGMDQDISLIPIMSGYRNKDTLEVNFTTYYEAINTDLNIVIRQQQILTASWFDFDVYKKLNLAKHDKPIKRLLLSVFCKR
jgi:hypothetical protein